MAKQLEKTAELEARLKTSVDNPDIDVTNLAVFEARMISTEPVSQKGFHDGARVSRSTLVEMSEFVNTQGTTVPLQIMHNKQVLPVGRVFSALVRDMPNGESELIGQFYIPQDDDFKTSLINDIEASVIDEVSIGLLAKKAICSECEFDYFGDEADFINILTMTCDNDHTIGRNGTHVRLVGMDTFAELSLVGRGAGKNAKILSRAKTNDALSKETVERLAASRIPAEAHLLTASYQMDSSRNLTNQGETTMSNGLETILATTSQKLGKVESELSQASDKITSLNSEIETLQASVAEKEAEIAALTAAQGEGITELTEAKTALETQLTEATEIVAPDLKAALIAAGEKEDDVPEDLLTMLSLIKEKGYKLHQMFGAEGGKADASKTDVKAVDVAKRRKANFKVK